MDNLQAIKNILLFFMFVLLFSLLIELHTLLVPLAMALMSALLFNPLIIYFKEKRIPKWVTIPLILILSLAIINFMIMSVVSTTNEIALSKDYFLNRLVLKLEMIFVWVNGFTGYNLQITNLNSIFNQIFTTQYISGFLSDLAGGVGSFSGSFIIFIIYYIILLIGMNNSREYISYVSGNMNDKPVLQSFDRIQTALVHYMKYKSLVNFVTAFFYTIILLIFGIKFFLFWGILAFFLNFIPNFGSLIATFFALVMALIQFDNPNTILLMTIIIFVSNFVFGSIIEPKLMGNRLKLNMIAVIFGLLFWGYIWGIPGMFLSVPLLVIMKIIFENFENLSVFGRLMGYPDKVK